MWGSKGELERMDCRVLSRKNPVSCHGNKGGKWRAWHPRLSVGSSRCSMSFFYRKQHAFFCGEQLSNSDIISYCPKKPKKQKQKTKTNLLNDCNGKTNMEKPISHLFSVHLLCTFQSTFDKAIFIFFSKLVCFLSSWGRKVYVNQTSYLPYFIMSTAAIVSYSGFM